MLARVSIIMGSTSDLPVMEKAAKVLMNFRSLKSTLCQRTELPGKLKLSHHKPAKRA